jgi:hypothetical protein
METFPEWKANSLTRSLIMNKNPKGGPDRIWLASYYFIHFLFVCPICYSLYKFIDVMAISFAMSPQLSIPFFTRVFFDHRLATLLLPLPWLAFSIMSTLRGRAEWRVACLFTASFVFAVLAFFVFMLIAFAIPWLPHKILYAR